MSAAGDVAEPDRRPPSEGTRERFFYGWTIVGFTFVAQFMTMGSVFYTFGVLLKPLTEALDADRFQVAIALSIQMVLVGLLGPTVGKLIAQRSIRALMLSGTALMSLGMLALSQAETLWQLYLAFGVIVSVGLALSGPLPNNALLANWFVRRRGTALGISQFGVTISGTAMVPLTTWMLLEYGWRNTVAIFGIAIAVVMGPLIWFLVVKRPEDRGLLPDGESRAPTIPEPEADPEGSQDEWTMGRALRDRRVWLLALVVGPSFTAIGSVVQAMHSHVTDLGMSGMQASGVIAVMTFMGAVAKPLFGVLADYVDKRGVMASSLALQIVGLALLLRTDSHSGLMVAGFIFGLGYGAVMPLFAVLLGALFGRDAFARVMGAMGPLMLPFTLVGLPFTTFVFERTGSYIPAFAALLVFYAVPVAALSALKLPESRVGAAA